MKILFLGNCQLNALRSLTRDMLPNLKVSFQTITPYWGKFDEVATREQLQSADLVVCQAIENKDTVFNVADVRSSTQGDIVFLPYVYVDGIASLEMAHSKGEARIKGAQQLLHQQEGRKPVEVFRDYCSGKIDMKLVERVTTSLEIMKQKEAQFCDIGISDYIADTFRDQPTIYAHNHPTQYVIFELHRRICEHLNWSFNPDLANDVNVWGRLALPYSQRALTPQDRDVLGLKYDYDSHWYSRGQKLIRSAIAEKEAA